MKNEDILPTIRGSYGILFSSTWQLK